MMEDRGTQSALNLHGRRCVITGGAAGLGFAIASALSDAGGEITVLDLQAALEGTDLPDAWGRVALDVGAADSLERMQALAEDLGVVDVLVANAGVVPPWRRLHELDAAQWQEVMAVNTWGVAASLGGFAGALARSQHGSAVVMASINGYRAHPSQVLYTASKHAAIGIMRAAAQDLGKSHTRVNALAPGPVATEALRARIEKRHAAGGPDLETALAQMSADTALGEMVTPQQVASAALWLASDASLGITGTVLPVEAGLN
jgi:NAD(P)-dependent dehydrogenase (short-subunit alcohol dehydrogenase family)